MKTNLLLAILGTISLTISLTAKGQNVAPSADAATMQINIQGKARAKATEVGSDATNTSKSAVQVMDKKDQTERTRTSNGTVNGGGGSFAEIDGQTVLADTFYKRLGKPQIFDKVFPNQLAEHIRSMLNILPAYGIVGKDFYESTIFDSRSVYALLTEEEFKQIKCDHYLPELDRPVKRHVQFGCTKGRTTYLVASEFTAAPLLEQSRAIIHERLWVNTPNADQRYIADFTTALGFLKKKQDDQIYRNNRDNITNAELEIFDDLAVAASQLGLSNGSDVNISPSIILQGGGRKYGAPILDEKSFAGIGTTLVNSTAKLVNSTVIGTYVKNSTISNSLIVRSKVQTSEIESSYIENSDLRPSDSSMKINSASIVDSSVSQVSIFGSPEQKVEIKSSSVSGTTYCKGGFLNCKERPMTAIASGVHIANSKLEYIGNLNPNIELDNFKFSSPQYYYGRYLMLVSGTKLQNLTWKYGPDSKISGFRSDPAAVVDGHGETLDFGGQKCLTTEWRIEIGSVSDLQKYCRPVDEQVR